MFGGSISDIINGRVAKEEDGAASIYYDPHTQRKILDNWEKFLAVLKAEHPRLGNALSETRVSGHTLSLSVGTDLIREEILRNQPEITALLHDHCGVEGSIILDVAVEAKEDSSTPLRPIDKVRFLMEKNPEVGVLIQDLDLEM